MIWLDLFVSFFGPALAFNKMTRSNFAAVIDLCSSCFQSESVKYFLDNLDRIGQLVSRRDDRHLTPVSFQSLITTWCFGRATSQASRTFCSRGRPPKASWSTTLSSRRSRLRWWTWEVRGRRGRSGFSVLTGSRLYFSWSHRRSTIR